LGSLKPRQIIADSKKPIGEDWSANSGTPQLKSETNYGSVFYGKKGAHIVPTSPNQW